MKERPYIIDKARNLFQNKAKEIHGDKYDYSKSIYVNSRTKLEIFCKNCNKYFWQTPNNHLRKRNCPFCLTGRGWSKSDWINFCKEKNKLKCILYILHLYNEQEEFIKIGITSNTVIRRYDGNKMPYNYEIIQEITGNPEFIWNKEKELHNLLKKFSYEPKIYFEGRKECFTKECLNIINNNYEK